MIDPQVLSALSDLYRIVDAGERGYATAAINAHNRGLKILFKAYAQQRANYKVEIMDEVQRLGGRITPQTSLPGMVHRGRVAIFAAMTIEDDKRERVILKEVSVGERYAARAYHKTLEANLAPETRAMVERQAAEVREIIEQIHLMLGKDNQNLVVRLFDSDQDANRAIQSLEAGSFPRDTIEKVTLDKALNRYQARGTTVVDTIISGMVGGMVWGSLIGVLAGIGLEVPTFPGWLGISSETGMRVLITVGIIVLAAIVGGLIGLVIGSGISESDTYDYQQSIQNGRYLVTVLANAARASEAGRLLDQVNNRPGEGAMGVST